MHRGSPVCIAVAAMLLAEVLKSLAAFYEAPPPLSRLQLSWSVKQGNYAHFPPYRQSCPKAGRTESASSLLARTVEVRLQVRPCVRAVPAAARA